MASAGNSPAVATEHDDDFVRQLTFQAHALVGCVDVLVARTRELLQHVWAE
jgi:hypothetical protein